MSILFNDLLRRFLISADDQLGVKWNTKNCLLD
jgi:hypothetical protein